MACPRSIRGILDRMLALIHTLAAISPVGATRVSRNMDRPTTFRERLDRARCSHVRRMGRHGRLPLRDQTGTLASAGCRRLTCINTRELPQDQTPRIAGTRGRHGLAALCSAGDWVDRRCHAARRLAAFQTRWEQGLSSDEAAFRNFTVPILKRGGTRGCCRSDTTGKTLLLFINDRRSPALRAKILVFPKGRTYDLTKPARLDTGDVMAIRHQT